MKKFLSVLLALSVAFTFTFGSTMAAFAAPVTYDNTDKYIEAVNTAETAALDYEAAQYAVAVAQAKTAKTVNVTAGGETIVVDTAYYLTQLETVYTAIQKDIKSVQTKALKSATGTISGEKIKYEEPAYTTYDSAAMLSKAKTDTTLGTTELNCATALVVAQLDANKADYVKAVGTVDTTIYSTTKLDESHALSFTDINSKTVKCYSAKDYADALKADYVARINAVVYDKDNDDLAALGTKVADLASYVAGVVVDTDADGIYTMVASIKKAADEDAENASKEAKIAAAKTEIQSNIATEYATAINTTNYNKAEWDKLVAAYTEAENYLAENADYSSPYSPATMPNDYAFNKDSKGVVTIAETTTSYITVVANVALLKAAVADVKAEKNTDGSVKYDAKSVDDAVANLVDTEYNKVDTASVTALTAATAKSAVAGASTAVVYVTEMAKAQAIQLAKDAYDAAKYDVTKKSTTYYPAEYAEYKKALDAYETAVNAAVTNADMTTASTALSTALSNVKKASAIAYTNTATDKAADALTNAKATAKAYVDTLNAGKDAKDQITYTPDMVTEFLMYNGARDAAAIVALYDALKADIAKTETPAQAKTAADAVQAKIDAIPALLTLTSANEADILAVNAAYNELSAAAKALVNDTDLGLAMTKMSKLVQADIEASAKAINKDLDDTAATIADKAALKAVAEKNATFKENYGAAVAAVKTYTDSALAKVKSLECKAVVDAVAALPTDITKENKAAVEAARAAYDAYVAEYTDLGHGKDGAADLKTAGINLEKLQAAEATIAEICKYTDKDAKAYMFDMKVTATAKKVTKTKAKMTIKADVTELTDNGYTVTYKYAVKAPGSKKYVTKKTSTKKSYTFTKLKKGKNTFKVTITVKNAEGKTVGTKTKTKTYTRK